MNALVGKMCKSATLKKIHFPKISEQAPLKSSACYIFTFTYFVSTLVSVIGTGGTFHGHETRPPGNLLKSNWQHTLGSGPQV